MGGEQLHQQLVGGLVAGVLELAALQALLTHLEQALARHGSQPLGQHMVIGTGRRRTAWSMRHAAHPSQRAVGLTG